MGSGGGGGDGGAADRKAAEDARQASAIARLNRAFGISTPGQQAPNRNDFMRPGAASSFFGISQPRKTNYQTPVFKGENAGAGAITGYQAPIFNGENEGAGAITGYEAATVPGAKGDAKINYQAPIFNGENEGAGAITGYENATGSQGDVFDEQGYQSALNQFSSESTDAEAQRNAREALYSQFSKDAKNLQLEDLNRDRSLAERDITFDLARRGLTGGSRQVDLGRDVSDQFNRGVLTAENNAQNVANQARQGDEKTRVGLINGIRGGMGEADAVTAALSGMRNTADQAANEARSQNIGGFFDAIRGAANARSEQDAYQKSFEKYRAGGGSGGGSYGGNYGKA